MNAVSLLSVLTVSQNTANALYIGVLSICQSLLQNFQVCKNKDYSRNNKEKGKIFGLAF